MSQAHRPTWNPTQGRETKSGSQQISKLSLAAHTKLKFRQPGQTNQGDVVRRDLKAELAEAERKAADKKRKAQGLPPLAPGPEGQLRIEGNGEEDEAAVKRRKVLEQAAELDKDDESGSEDEEEAPKDKGKGKAVGDEDEDSDDSDDDSDDEDDTAALMAELAKIKQERAEEKARLDEEAAAKNAVSREAEIATGNPLMNLQAALGTAPDTPGSTTASSVSGGFAVKKRWDDDVIFKNQAVGIDDRPKKGEFVNDLLRSEFHKKFMNRFIK
ncbi:hypothetical protein L202_07597 [Cryptococcus amylolentus CBS 6039]|uniref:Pre-mRNA-splicing factor CWC15 n=2 Tax=Cryptococcus amylolentus TaxID=104669 RepID=A0A1E3HEF6_9TREE|nr:hypothetical protein L202_07597 [Cryptococcus amylolentus CBS 6039]ODN74146.1 hypothetical protein L202_07597 [Cryptococcus amylolentus CBS 6039]ODO00077.1 hypothetical protein I350_06702 [Cryptococcus amylolentus CBS 6273]